MYSIFAALLGFSMKISHNEKINKCKNKNSNLKFKMELCKIEDTNRMKINFKIPMKSQNKPNDNSGSTQIEKYTSPLASEYQPENNTEYKSSSIEISTTRVFNESNNEVKPAKRKLNSEVRLYAGRNIQYPEELNNLILPLFCKLCNAALNSAKTAHFHYISKSHEKKINNWFIEWSKRTGEPIPKLPKDEKTVSRNSGVLHCEFCNVTLTSLQDARQHYSGKKHTSKINSGALPVHKKNVESLTNPTSPTIVSTDGTLNIEEQFKPPESTFCEICNIHTTSEHQLIKHKEGVKHFKKFRELYPEQVITEKDLTLTRQMLNCRTPSGQFYCKTCQMTVIDDKIFSQHLISKRHAKNVKKENESEKIKKLDTLTYI